MKEVSNNRSKGHKLLIGLLALIGGFLLSFVGFGVLWSGISWHYQLIMFLPFLLLSLALTRWGKGAPDSFILILCGAAPLGILITQFRDNNDSHLLPILMVSSWLIGIFSGYFLAKISPDSRSESLEDNSSS
ncbi:hypothetical protein C8R34_10346 [Nitrosomonas sp. Nm84]|uniref:lysophosphatidic acid receptor n=1 Tax=Nitrosomonas sp. Nm84 TaxID=200124 RepID=UPI000D771ADA|nr:lysophosphatidic acid receptor [Nitrosomonas sp. Nm84]PXW89889.1 hypothetical protein C8R34_10346 [Nitrosomonas sp. Nm84]